MPTTKTKSPEDKLKCLEDKVDYAGACIECETTNAEKAKEFLNKLYFKIEKKPRHTRELSRLQEKIYAILAPYGLKPEGGLGEDNNKKDPKDGKA